MASNDRSYLRSPQAYRNSGTADPSTYVVNVTDEVTNSHILLLNPTELPPSVGPEAIIPLGNHAILTQGRFQDSDQAGFGFEYYPGPVPCSIDFQRSMHFNSHILYNEYSGRGTQQELGLQHAVYYPNYMDWEINDLLRGSVEQYGEQSQQIMAHEHGNTREGKRYSCGVCQKAFPSNRDLYRHQWSTHPIYAAEQQVPPQKASCDAPGCTYVGRKDNLVRHIRLKHNSKTGK